MASDLIMARGLVAAWLSAGTWSADFPVSEEARPWAIYQNVPETLECLVFAAALDMPRISRGSVDSIAEIHAVFRRQIDHAADVSVDTEIALVEEVARAASARVELEAETGELFDITDSRVAVPYDADEIDKGLYVGEAVFRLRRMH